MGNLATKIFNAPVGGSITIPAGVTSVSIVAKTRRGIDYSNSWANNNRFSILDAYGNVYGWGANQSGQLGTNDIVFRSSPTLVVGGLTWASVAATGSDDIMYLSTNGGIYGAGFNQVGDIGDNTQTPRSSPTLAVGGLKYRKLCSTAITVFGITEGGAMYAWGNGSTGQGGTGGAATYSSPTLVVGGLSWYNVFPAIYSVQYQFALDTLGHLYGFGFNNVGQLGVGDTTNRSSPTQIAGGGTWTQCALAADGTAQFAVGLNTDGNIYGWGSNAKGSLGQGNTTNRSSPGAVVGGLTWQQVITTLNGGVLGVTTAGVAYGWGSNANGQLGVGNTVARSSPVAVLGGLTFAKLYSTNNGVGPSVWGITTSGAAYGWGINTNGQLGDGTTTVRSSPVAVVGGLTFSDILYASTAVVALTTDGKIYCWGLNSSGELGDGTTTTRSSPVAVVGNLAPILGDSTVQQTIAVTPGTAYAVTLGGNVASFGSTFIGGPNVYQVQVSFEQ